MKPRPVSREEVYKKTLLTIGEKLTELRKKKGYKTRMDFALDHDLAHIQYWRIEKGATNVTLKSLDRILEIHGISIIDFFNDLNR
jgi:transcriptional regulator with XRE-family HTH domain